MAIDASKLSKNFTWSPYLHSLEPIIFVVLYFDPREDSPASRWQHSRECRLLLPPRLYPSGGCSNTLPSRFLPHFCWRTHQHQDKATASGRSKGKGGGQATIPPLLEQLIFVCRGGWSGNKQVLPNMKSGVIYTSPPFLKRAVSCTCCCPQQPFSCGICLSSLRYLSLFSVLPSPNTHTRVDMKTALVTTALLCVYLPVSTSFTSCSSQRWANRVDEPMPLSDM